MDPSSPWADWDRSKVGSLKTRLDREQTITPEDLAVILEGDEACVPDPLLRKYLLLALRDGLRPPRGRPKSDVPDYMLAVAEILIDQEVELVRGEIASGTLKRHRGDPEPKAIAAERVVGIFRNITGAHLRNQISAMKKRNNDVRE